MPEPDLLIAFVAATALFALMPGPGMLYSAARTLTNGRRAGLRAALGLHMGGYVHVTAASLGLAAVFDVLPVLFMALKLAGAAYLIWLGLQMLRARSVPVAGPQKTATPTTHAFWQSVIVEVLNPKTVLFYVAFLPQFTDPAAAIPVWMQLFLLGTVVNVLFSCGDLVAVLMADRITAWSRQSDAVLAWARRLGGACVMGLGIRLVLDRS